MRILSWLHLWQCQGKVIWRSCIICLPFSELDIMESLFYRSIRAWDYILRCRPSGWSYNKETYNRLSIVHLSNYPICWMSKKQASVETSFYGSKFTALKHCSEYLQGRRYKSRMIGIPWISYFYLWRQEINSSEFNYRIQLWRRNPAQSLIILSLPGGMKREQLTEMIYHHVYTWTQDMVESIVSLRTPLSMIFY